MPSLKEELAKFDPNLHDRLKQVYVTSSEVKVINYLLQTFFVFEYYCIESHTIFVTISFFVLNCSLIRMCPPNILLCHIKFDEQKITGMMIVKILLQVVST